MVAGFPDGQRRHIPNLAEFGIEGLFLFFSCVPFFMFWYAGGRVWFAKRIFESFVRSLVHYFVRFMYSLIRASRFR